MDYYNEHDPFAAAWLRQLIADGLIPPGVVDERDIQQVQPSDLVGYRRCHFFAGIGGWAYALELAGWGNEPVWTGSCPCQPFSAAGKGDGASDPRHLWPAWFRLVRECRPSVVFGEQVASIDGLAWFDLVSTDMEGADYAVGAVDLPACSVGAPHIRQRLWFVADTERGATKRHGFELAGAARAREGQGPERQWIRTDLGDGGNASGVADDIHDGRSRQQATRLHERRTRTCGDEAAARDADGPCGDNADGRGLDGGMGDTAAERLSQGRTDADLSRARRRLEGPAVEPPGGPWSDVEWLHCSDGKARPTQPGLFPLAHGVPNRVGTLRGAGNAIVPQVAAEFIAAYLDAR